MTPEEKRCAIAEAHGWQDCHSLYEEVFGVPPRTPIKDENYYEVPDYLNDRNAIVEAVLALPTNDLCEFGEWLCHITRAMVYEGDSSPWIPDKAVNYGHAFALLATASCEDLAEAYLRTIRK